MRQRRAMPRVASCTGAARDAAMATIVLDSPAGADRTRACTRPSSSRSTWACRISTRSSLPFEASRRGARISAAGRRAEVEIGAVSMGNPHAVLARRVRRQRAGAIAWGRAIESHPRFPKRVNVGFMEIVDACHIRLRVYERGVGETLACGTGACAAVAVGRRHGRARCHRRSGAAGRKARDHLGRPGEHIWMKGPTAVSFTGRVEI